MENKTFFDDISNIPTKAFWTRWYILFAFIYYSCINGIQMTEYSSVTEIIAKYYKVSTFAVNWTTLVYMVLYPFLVIPASYVINTKGLRAACLYGCTGTATGTIIKIFSIQTDRFWVVMLGQIITAASLVFIMCLPPKIAAVWFKPSEISLACFLGTVGPNMGNAFGYLLTVSIVSDNDDLNVIGNDLKKLCWTIAVSIVPVTIAMICYFPKEPLLPPSQAQARVRANAKNNYQNNNKLSSIKAILLTKGFLIHMASYAINIGVVSTMMTLLSEFVNAYFSNASMDAGWMGFCMLASGLVGSIAFGAYLDKFHHYKGTCIFLYVMATSSIVLFIMALVWKLKSLAYVMCTIFGIFINPFIPAGFEFGIELTYPHEESTVSGLLFAASQILSVILAGSVAYINSNFGPFCALVTLPILLILGTLVEACVPNRLMRQCTFQRDQYQRK